VRAQCERERSVREPVTERAKPEQSGSRPTAAEREREGVSEREPFRGRRGTDGEKHSDGNAVHCNNEEQQTGRSTGVRDRERLSSARETSC